MTAIAERTTEGRAPRKSTEHMEIRRRVREILTNSRVEIVKSTSGKVDDLVATYQIAGEGVATPFLRYYLGKKLDKKLVDTGYHAIIRRKERGIDKIHVDVFVGERLEEASEVTPAANAA